MISKNAVILGYDAVSPLGLDIKTQWDNAKNGQSGIGPLTRFPVDGNFPVKAAGEVDELDTSPYPFLSPRALAQWKSPLFKYALLVAHRALKRSKIIIDSKISPRVGITFSSAVGGQDAVLNADRRFISEGKLPPPYTNPNSCINMIGGKISILTNATGPITSTVNACATGVTSMIVGDMLLKLGKADVVICGAVDFSLVEPIVAGFATMNSAYRPKSGTPHEPFQKVSRPFSINRRGFVISEGAGCIIISTKEFAKTHGLDFNIGIAGWSMTSDAHHFVAPNLKTVTRCISESIQDAGIDPTEIHLVNAHAASTKLGDKVEFDALKMIFGDDMPPVSANKSLMGHAMGASSAIESIYAIKGMTHDTILPTINYQSDPDMVLDCVSEGERHLKQEFVLKNAFGFGGCNACIVFKCID